MIYIYIMHHPWNAHADGQGIPPSSGWGARRVSNEGGGQVGPGAPPGPPPQLYPARAPPTAPGVPPPQPFTHISQSHPPGPPPGPPPRPPPRQSATDTQSTRAPVRLPRAPPRPRLTPDIDKEVRCCLQVESLRAERHESIKSYYLVTDKSGGSTRIPPYFALQSALMELGDADIELNAARARAESVEESLVRMQEDAFAYTAASIATDS